MRLVVACAGAIAIVACDSPKKEPPDIDLATARAGFHCDAPRDADAKEACRILDAFAAAGAITDWPAGDDVQIWLGVDHCVKPTTSADYAAYQLVYLRAGKGSGPSDDPPDRVLAYAGVFGSSQIKKGADPPTEDAMRALATGATPDPSKTGNLLL